MTGDEEQILKHIEEGEKDIFKLSEKTQLDAGKVNYALIQLGTKGFIEVELPGGKPKIKGITERGRNEIADNTWIFE